MDNPRSEKVAVVDEVRERLESSDAVLLTEYRGIDVDGMATLRRSLREAGGEYKVYKNTLVRLATRALGMELDELLTGPTAIAFVPTGGGGDPVAVAKALKSFAKDNPNLVIKGGLLGDKFLSPEDTKALAEIAPREELLARLAGGMAAPMQQFAGLLQALPRNFAYGLSALIDQGGAPGAPADVADTPSEEAPSTEQADTSTEDAPSTEQVDATTEDTTSEEAPSTEQADATPTDPTPAADAAPTDDPGATGDTSTEES